MDWKEILHSWFSKKKNKNFEEDSVLLFEKAFANTLLPEKSWFGYPPSKSSLGLFLGRLMLVGIYDGIVEVLVDEDLSDRVKFYNKIVGSSKTLDTHFYWIETDIENIKEIVENKIIWEHYKKASLKIYEYSRLRYERADWVKNKYRLSEIYNDKITFDNNVYELLLESEIKNSKLDKKEVRLKRLETANKMPSLRKAEVDIYIRNSDVIVEVLERANGYCEYCKRKAPFIKDSNGEGYLEVHHVTQLSEGEEDTINNCAALCPNWA